MNNMTVVNITHAAVVRRGQSSGRVMVLILPILLCIMRRQVIIHDRRFRSFIKSGLFGVVPREERERALISYSFTFIVCFCV